MDHQEVLIRARQIGSEVEREAYLVEQCEGDREKVAAFRNLLVAEDELRRKLAGAVSEPAEQPPEKEPGTGGSTADEPTGVMPADVQERDDATLDGDENDRSSLKEGTTIAGRYILQNRIGEGGMGEVWAARQIAPVKRRVALKLIKRGMDSRAVLARFEQERQALALMDHPNIARVLDGGMTETGQSFFAMELVNGLPLTKFADESRLTTTERLELFVSICQAVQHAHQKGIIHRDLKPANIMVTIIDGRPVPKVIDFGVAKATGGSLVEQSVDTQFGAVVGTLEYMSPEQAGFSGIDIDTRADIYSLGIVLYELLTGLRPIDKDRLREAGVAEMIRVIREEDPSRPSTRLSTSESLPSLAAIRRITPRKLTAMLKGELDWVVMKCLEKSRDRRYDTANGLARDIQRFLDGEAVEARPPSAAYRLSKFLRRNKGSVIAGTLIFSALIAGVSGSTWGWLEARRQSELANTEALTQRAVSSFLRDDILAQAGASTQSDSIFQPDPAMTVRTALNRASGRIRERFSEQPLVLAALHRTIGNAYRELGEFSASEPHLDEAMELYCQHQGSESKNSYLLRQDLGELYRQQEKLDQSEKLLYSVCENFRSSGAETRESLRAAAQLADCYAAQSRANHSEEKRELSKRVLQETLNSQRRLLGETDPDVCRTLLALAMMYRTESKATADPKLLDLAETTVQQTLTLSSALPDNHPDRLVYLYSHALVLIDKLEYERALKIQEQVMAGCIETFGEVHPTSARAMDSLAMNYMVVNRMDEAEETLKKSLAMRRKMYGDDHPVTEHATFSLGQFYYNSGNMEKAAPLYQERLARNRRRFGDDAVDTHLAGRDLAMIYAALGRTDEAAGLLESALKAFRTHFEDSNPIVSLTREYHAEVLMSLGRIEEALSIYEETVRLTRAMPNPNPVDLASSIASLGQCQLMLKQFVAAEASFRESAESFSRHLPEAWPTFVYRSKIGESLAGQKKFAEAETILLESFEAMKVRRKSIPPPLYDESINAIIQLYTEINNPIEVERWQNEKSETVNVLPESESPSEAR